MLQNKAIYAALILPLLFFFSCEDHDSNGPPKLSYASEADFIDTSNVAIRLEEGFEISLWAPGPLLANAVAISIDNQGVAYVTETQRRKSSDLDIRSHRDWMTEDLALQALEDTEQFHLGKLASENSEQNNWLEDFDQNGLHDWNDLTVQSERVLKIWDSDGDGRADISSIFAKDMNEMLTGVAAGVLYHNNDIYVTAAPNLYRMTDIDGDGDSDKRKILSRGYGIHIAYAGHDMSGLTMGPDGKIYWSIGDIGVNAADSKGNQYAYPNQGAVMRCNPDGTDFEVFAHGLRNPQELAFDKNGNLISVDNDGDHPGEHERFVHILEGSDSGWRINWQYGKYNEPHEEYKVWMDEKLHVPHFAGQAAYILPPLALAPDGPAGLIYQPGMALNSDWENYFFGSYFKGSAAKSKIQAFRLEPKGVSFSVAETRDVLSGIVSTGLAIGPDGALYINDWLESYDKKEIGRIWKLDVIQKNQEQREETRLLLAKGTNEQSKAELKLLLGHADMRVRLNAQFELVSRKAQKELLSVMENQHGLANLHAIWGLGQLARADQSVGKVLVPFLQHNDSEVRAQTAKVLGDARFRDASDALLTKLADDADRVKYFAAEALGKLAEKRAFEPLVELLEQVGDSDPHFRHGLVYALSQLGMVSELAELANHASVSVRLGAVVALRQLRAAELSRFLADSDSLVLIETARAIHDDQSVPEALPALAEALSTGEPGGEAFLRRAINANLRIGNETSAKRLASYANSSNAPEEMRIDALWALGYWQSPPVLDRVDGRYRPLADRDLMEAQQAFAPVAGHLLESDNTTLRAATAEAVGRLQYRAAESTLVRYCLQESQPVTVRRAALQSLADLKSVSLQEVITTLLDDYSLEIRTDAQTLIASIDLPPSVIVEMLGIVIADASIPEKQKALKSLSKLEDPSAAALLGGLLKQLTNGKIEAPLQLDVIMAVQNSGFHNLKQELASFESGRVSEDQLVQYEETLHGGNSITGRRIFYRNNSAQCIRCHKLGSTGGDVGPNLEAVASKLNRTELLAALIDPSRRLAPGYGTVSLELVDGQKVVGVIENDDSESIQIRNSEGELRDFTAEEIKTKTYFSSSMPSMQEVLTKEEIRDLMAFLVEQNQ